MKTIFTIITFAFITTLYARYSSQTITYEVDVKNHKDDLFHVTVFINGLSSDNNIYNLPATVPVILPI